MPIHFRCDYCSRTLSVARRKAGCALDCPVCGQPVVVPSAEASLPTPDVNGPKTCWIEDGPATPATQTSTQSADWWVSTAPAPAPTPTAAIQAETPSPLPPISAPPDENSPRRIPPLVLAGAALLLASLACLVAVLALPRRTSQTGPDDQHVQGPPPASVGTPTPGDPVAPRIDPPSARLTLDVGPPLRREPETEILPPPNLEQAGDPAPMPTEVVKKPTPAAEFRVVVKRHKETREEDLLKQIATAPELRLDRNAQRLDTKHLLALGRKARQSGIDDAAVTFMEKRNDLAGLPFRKGDACKISPTASNHLEGGSLALRDFLAGVANGRPAGAPLVPDPKHLHTQLNKDGRDHNRWLKSEAIPALQQLLMAEHEAIREVLVAQLAKIEGKRASEALALRALFDLHPRVRERALVALAKRPVSEYRDTLLGGFHHPWPAVAEHAAEALVALKMTDTVTSLLALLDMPDPQAPYKGRNNVSLVKEMVRINHLANCVMCHAPSTKQDDRVRGRVPETNQALPPAFTRQYYSDRTGTFVRADVTYLKQDFSVPLPVKNHGLWPEVQRFDFVLRVRPATVADSNAAKKRQGKPSEQHQAVFFALRELTGADPGPTIADWKQHFLKRDLKVKAVFVGLKNPRGLAVDGEGRLYISDSGVIFRKEGDARPALWSRQAGGVEGLATDVKGNVLAVQAKAGQLLRFDASSGEAKILAARFKGKRFHLPRRLAVDRNGGVYLSDDADEVQRTPGAVYYVSAHGSVTKLSVELTRPHGLGLSPDGKTLYIGSVNGEVMAHPVESAGNLGKGKRLARVGNSPADLAVDRNGNLSILDATTQSVVMLAPTGAKLAMASLPDVPTACAIHKETLYVLTKKGIYSIDLTNADATRMTMR